LYLRSFQLRSPLNRRSFLGSAITSAAALGMARSAVAADPSATPQSTPSFSVFTKPLASLSFDELADRIAELGFDGIEAPIRKGGHITPAEAPDRLPALVESLSAHGLTLTIMTSDINDPDDPMTEKVLRTAATLGIPQYRMAYYKYDLKQPIMGQVREFQAKLQSLAAIHHDFGIQGLYQNHAGRDYFGAALWDLHAALQGIAPADLAVAYDLRHAIAEGGNSWPTTLELIRDHIAAIYVKDFRWDGDQIVNVPLGEGRVGRRQYQSLHRSDKPATWPVSLHEEYLDHSDPALVPKHLAAMKQDLDVLKSWH
jgi:sugar phosphate isomerase/epimerase